MDEIEYASGVEDLLSAEDIEQTVEATVEIEPNFAGYARVEVPAAYMTREQIAELIAALQDAHDLM